MKSVSLSVILPCYNVAKYIERAVDSILRQDFEDYEVIIINDGSPDNLLDICKKWGGKSNFKIITTANQGVAQARNEGLRVAIGEYVFFMDPDDYINQGMFREVMSKCHEGNFDAVHFGFQKIYEDQGGLHYDKAEPNYIYSSNTEIISSYMPKFIGFGQNHINSWKVGNIWDKIEFASVWRFFFKRSVIENNKIDFDKGVSLNEDRWFCIKFFLYASHIATINKVYYNYIVKNNGLMTGSIGNFDKLVKDKISGISGRALLRKLYLEKKGIDIFKYYNGTVVIGALEIIVRGAHLPIFKCIKAVKQYLSLEDVKEAYKTTNFNGFSNKMKYPAFMVKYGLMPLLVILIHLGNKIGIKFNAD